MSAEWKQRPEGGGWFAIWAIRTVARHGGRGVARLLLYPITLYFLVLRGPERRASRAYLTRVLARPASLLDVARHIHTFAATILDRVFLLGENTRRFQVDVDGLDELHDVLDRGHGVLLFGSHLGSFEVMRVLARARPNTPLRVLLDRGHNPAVTQLLEALNPKVAATVIDAGQDGPTILLEIQQAIGEGAIVALLVDRAQRDGTTLRMPFLDAPAPFPTAPWAIAAVLHAPIMLAFGLYRGGNRYQLIFEPFSDGLRLARAERAQAMPALIARYAARLEHHVRSAPYNWFNFYDFWDTEHDDSATRHAPLVAPIDAGDTAGERRRPVVPGG